jgi:hypothetical protein
VPYKPGSYFLTQVPGRAGFWIGVGQALAGDASRYGHAGIVVSEAGDVVEAEPGGARIGNLSRYAGQPLLISDAPVVLAGGDEAATRARVVAEARKLLGTPYSPLDYLALALLHLHLPLAAWVRKRVESSGHLICSALVDRAYRKAGLHLFTDGRLTGDVMPADLAAWAEDH